MSEPAQDRMFFDGEIEREWPAEGLLLDGLPERVRRAVIGEWMRYLVPSRVGEERFEFVTQNRSQKAKQAKLYFSTCGELAMTALYVIGYRGRCLNRDLTANDGGPRKYVPGKNMSLLMGQFGGPSVAEGAWVSWTNLRPLPQLGDIICVTEGPPRSEHVMVMMEPMNIDSDVDIDALYVAEAGRGGTHDQHSGFDAKSIVSNLVGGRTCVGFLDIGKLKLTARAKLPPLGV